LILCSALFIFGIGDSLLISSKLGNAPWSVLAQGLSNQLGISIGAATLLVSAIVLALWLPLKERPGFGTIMNILIIAGAIDLGLWLFPEPESFIPRLGYVLLGISLVGLGSAFYISCGLGPGPRDGWMTALHRRTGVRIGRVRLGIELTVLTLGWVLGGTVGLGTALFALFIGHSVAISFGVVSRITAR
jgi:uncharacterized membrane protein YczE